MPANDPVGVPPYPLAMVICDAIWRDPGTGKRVLLGLFSMLQVREFPATHPMMAVHVALTDGHGKVKMRLRLVDANEEGQPLFEGVEEVDFADPMTIAEIDFGITNIRFEMPGEYRLQLLAGDEPLMERKIFVIQAPQ